MTTPASRPRWATPASASAVRASNDALAGAADDVRSMLGRELRVLLAVHTEQDAAQALLALRQGGFTVHHTRASSIDALRQALPSPEWDVVIADFQMPGRSALETLATVRQGTPGLPVVLICGSIGEDAAVDAIRQGAGDCILLTQLHRRLAQAVQRQLDQRALRHALHRPHGDNNWVAHSAEQSLASFPVAIYVCDCDGRILRYNRAAAALWGREPDLAADRWASARSILGTNGQPLSHEQLPAAVVARTGLPIAGAEVVIERDDGTTRHVEHHPRPLRDDTGNITGVIDMLIDITERKRQERRLLLSDETSRNMFDNSPAPCMMNLPGKHISSVNDRFVELSGYRRAELVGRTVDALGLLVDDSDGRAVRAALQRDGRIDTMEFNFRRKSGEVRRAMVSTTRVNIGGVEQYLHSFADLTPQREALAQARLARQAFASISQGILISDAQRMTISVNQAFERMTGYTEAELAGRSCALLQGPDSSPATVLAIRQALDRGQAYQGEILNYRKDGTPFWNALSISPVTDTEGRLTHFVGIQQDITTRKEQEIQRKLTEQIFAQSHEGVIVTDARRRIVMVNQAFTTITGYAAAEVLGGNPQLLSSGRQDAAFYRDMWRVVRRSGSWQGEIWNRHRSGREYLEWLTINVLHDAQGNVTNYIGTFSDITEQRAAQDKIDWLAHFDPLTGLANRTLLADRCGHDIHVAGRDNSTVVLLALDMDGFRQVNDSLGFSVGDKVIQKFARRLARLVRAQDTVARLQGDEFVLALPGESAEGASALVTRLLHILAEPFGVGDTEVTIKTSIGVAVYPSDGDSFDALSSAAQVAMQHAKDDGGNQFRFHSPAMYEATVAKQALGTALRSAIAQDQLLLHYQPFVDMLTGRIGGMEALLRWNHPDLGMVPPGKFIPLAEQTGQIVDIGNWVLCQACRDIRDWRAGGLEVPPVSVNLSPLQFRDAALLDNVRSAMQEHGIAAEQICLELTEGAVMDDVPHSEQVMHALKALGVRLSLDDFGTGYSSLSYLKRFPFDKVKIDQSFVRDIHSSTQDAVIAKVVISMAHGLGLRVIAEGVETEMQCDFMRRNRCDEIQGYFFSRPVPAAQMQDMLREARRLPVHLVREQARNRTLLLVDDEPDAIAALQRLLQPDGYRILHAGNGPEAVQLLSGHSVDMIVSGLHPAGMTGQEILRQAKRLHPQSIRILMSAHGEPVSAATGAIDDDTDYRILAKPWDAMQLRSFIGQAFRQKELGEENEQLDIRIRAAQQQLAASQRQSKKVRDTRQQAAAPGTVQPALLRDTFAQLPWPMLVLTDTGTVDVASHQAEQLLGETQPLAGRPLGQVMPALHAMVWAADCGSDHIRLADGRACVVEWQVAGSNGRLVRLGTPQTEAGA
ncbi:EAL domain-containing protein [Comamonadaceae bacterium G21597-S1]|nr:EAL domain-containing protein [Comamonadaceae bacterium G21597-S1]